MKSLHATSFTLRSCNRMRTAAADDTAWNAVGEGNAGPGDMEVVLTVLLFPVREHVASNADIHMHWHMSPIGALHGAGMSRKTGALELSYLQRPV